MLSRWQNRLGESTWRKYRSIWKHFTEKFLPTTQYKPEQLPKLSAQEASDLAENYYNFCLKEGRASYTARGHYTAVRSFFMSQRIQLDKLPRKFRPHRTYETDRLLKPQEIYEMLMAITGFKHTITRNRALIATWATTLQRRAVITSLQFKHFLQTKPEDYYTAVMQTFTDPPAVAEIPAFMPNNKGENVNKAQTRYRFGIVEDACKFIREMLQVRSEDGEPLDNKDVWLFRSYGKFNSHGLERIPIYARGPPIDADTLNTLVVNLAEKVGIQETVGTKLGRKQHEIHAHINRRYGKDRMKNVVKDRDLLEFTMGHQLQYNGAYDKYDRTTIKEAFRKATEHLNFIPKPLKTEEAITKAQIQILLEKLPLAKRQPILDALNLPAHLKEAIVTDSNIMLLLKKGRTIDD